MCRQALCGCVASGQAGPAVLTISCACQAAGVVLAVRGGSGGWWQQADDAHGCAGAGRPAGSQLGVKDAEANA